MNIKPTQYEDVNLAVQLLLQKSREILGKNLLAMYLHGSLATGDFNQKKSDIDFIIVLDKEISDETTQKLQDMLGELSQYNPKWFKKLEGSYVPKDWLKRDEPP